MTMGIENFGREDVRILDIISAVRLSVTFAFAFAV